MSSLAEGGASSTAMEVDDHVAPTDAAVDGKADEDDDTVASDVDEDTLLTTEAAAKKKPLPSSSSSSSSSSSPSALSALDRLNLLLQQTEQFSSYTRSSTANSASAPKENSARSHLDAKEKEEDAALVEDELEEETQTAPQFTRLLQQPACLNGSMRDYQLEALNWLIRLHEQQINGILADEMGLGKTLESLSLLSYLKAYRDYAGPHLIVVPKSTSSNWMREIARWTPNLTAMKFHGTQEERETQKLQLGKADVTVTTYEMVIREKSALKKVRWRYLYIDEAHRIKNEHSLLATVVRTFSTEHRLLITGTPLQNSLHELWALLNFLVPSMFDQASDFEQWFDLTGSGAEGEKMTMVSRLHRILRPFLLRRLKSDVEATLLPKVETNLYVGLSAMQRSWYAKILSREVEVLNGATKANSKTGKLRLLNIVMQLRKVTNHPYLFQGAEPGPPYIEGEHLITNSGKMVLLDKLLKRLKQNGHRCLPEGDTRVLTDSGFLFLREIEARIEAKEEVLYACYDIDTQGIVYRPGRLVFSAPPTRWVDFTQAGTQRLWDSTSDDYGSTVPTDGERANGLTLRTTPDHDMYVQLCTKSVDGYNPRKAGGGLIPPHKMRAEELAPGYKCSCAADGRTCTHGYSHYRMFTAARSGLRTPEDVISLTNHSKNKKINDSTASSSTSSSTSRTTPTVPSPPSSSPPHSAFTSSSDDLASGRSPVVALDLRSTDELNAFLELFGYWLGDGTMAYDDTPGGTHASQNAVQFSPKKERDRPYLRCLLARLHLERGQHFTLNETDRALTVRITDERWFRFFDDEFGVKYSNSRHYDPRQALLKQGMHSSQRRPLPASTVSAAASASVASTDEDMPPLEPSSPPALGDPSVPADPDDPPMEEDPPSDDDDPSDPSDLMDPEEDDNDDEDDPVKSAKWLPYWVLHRLDRWQLQLVIEGLRLADGYSAASAAQMATAAADGSTMAGLRMICTSGLGFRDQLVHACLHAGYSAYFKINTRAGAVRGFKAHGDSAIIYTPEEMEAALRVEPNRQFKPVRGRHDNWWVCYDKDVSELLPARDVRFDGRACSIRPEAARKQGWVARHAVTGEVRQALKLAELAALLKCSSAAISAARTSGAFVKGVWTILSEAQHKEQSSGQDTPAQQAAAAATAAAAAITTQPGDLYDEKRDRRVWCVEVEHDDALIFAQRAHRNDRGVVTKVGRSMIVGNCLIFSQMTRLLDILEDFMRWRGYEYSRIDGQTKQEERDDSMDVFNAPNSTKFCFLLSTRAGGLGINLQTADTVILYDSDWNPQMDLQAQDRAHRIGQKKQVRVFRFVTEDSIEQKIVERAMKKLLLDALVIKQGRLADADKSLDAQELQEMVRFGASRIFSSGESSITDADIDVILEEGREKTEKEREKLKEVAGGVGSGGLLNFSIGANEKNLMEFEGRDYSGVRAAAGRGMEFINLPQRERKATGYSDAQYFRDVLRVGESRAKGVKREFKPAQRLDFQFFDPRLEELEKKEFEGEQRYRELKAKRIEDRKEKRRMDKHLERERVMEERRQKRLAKLREKDAGEEATADADGSKADDLSEEEVQDDASRASPSPSPSPLPPADPSDPPPAATAAKPRGRPRKAKPVEEEEAEDGGAAVGDDDELDDEELRTEAGCLTAEEEAEKEELEGAGFGDWQRKHFNGYIRACERYGRDNERDIAESGLVEGKSAKEVRAYHHAFLAQHSAIRDWEKLLERIEKGEAKREKLNHLQAIIDAKVRRHRRPLETLTLTYPTVQRLYTAEEDRFLVCSLHTLGYGNWEEVKAEVRRSWMFRFDWFLKSRTAAELQKRADYLMKCIEKENEDLAEAAKKKGKGGPQARKGAAAAPVKRGAAATATGKRKANAPAASRSHKRKK